MKIIRPAMLMLLTLAATIGLRQNCSAQLLSSPQPAYTPQPVWPSDQVVNEIESVPNWNSQPNLASPPTWNSPSTWGNRPTGSSGLNRQSEPNWYPYIIARGQDRTLIESTPIEMRPYRPLHVYGNTVRRTYYRGSPLPVPSDLTRGAIAPFRRR